VVGDISGEIFTIHSGPNTEKNIVIGDGRERHQLATLDRRREVHEILHWLQVELFDLSNLRRQEPTSLFVVAQLRWDFDCHIAGVTPFLLYLFNTARPQIGI
jgi:hypothetical protein